MVFKTVEISSVTQDDDAKEMSCNMFQKKRSNIMAGGRKLLAVLMAVSHLFHALFRAARKLLSLKAFRDVVEQVFFWLLDFPGFPMDPPNLSRDEQQSEVQNPRTMNLRAWKWRQTFRSSPKYIPGTTYRLGCSVSTHATVHGDCRMKVFGFIHFVLADLCWVSFRCSPRGLRTMNLRAWKWRQIFRSS